MVEVAPVEISRVGALGVFELAVPQKFNSLSMASFRIMEAALDDFERGDSGIRAILIRAQGKHFCTGADLVEAKELRREPAKLAEFIHLGQRLLKRFEASELPFIAACQGLVLAGGAELMLACDVVFAANDFRFGDQHAQYGLIPGFGGTQRLPRLIGLRRSLDLFYSANWIDAQTALQWGLVNHLVEQERLGEAALAYCVKLTTRSRQGIAAMKTLARQGVEGTLEAGLAQEEAMVVPIMLDDDVSEGLAAFEGRRAPVFTS